MAQEMSIEAILSAVDQNFTKTMEAAVDSLSKVVGQSNQTASATTSATSSVKNLATSLGLVAVAGKGGGDPNIDIRYFGFYFIIPTASGAAVANMTAVFLCNKKCNG